MSMFAPTQMVETLEREPNPMDTMRILAGNLLQQLGLTESYDGAPVAAITQYTGGIIELLPRVINGKLEELAGGPLFKLLFEYFEQYGPVFKLTFGPKSFIVVSDPVMAKHILRTSPFKYDKGILSEILEPVMGKGLIPADPVTWKARRRAIVPGFHKRWLNHMMGLFHECNGPLHDKLAAAAASGDVVDMETEFCSVSLDIIGKAVFNYKFESVTSESPVIKAVYSALREAEHRSTSFIPYWKLPLARYWFPQLREFHGNMRLLNTVLNELIAQALDTQDAADVDELTERSYDGVEDTSLLRFLVDMRGEETTSQQLRDDLMTLLVAGHETTAAVLTWTLFELSRSPEALAEVRAEVDEVLGDRPLSYDDLPSMRRLRAAICEGLRLYPQPPLLIRRALQEDVLPAGGAGRSVRLPKGTDVFISTWNLHHSPALWKDPETFRPSRFLEENSNPDVEGWGGFRPDRVSGLYVSEQAADFAFLPFGGGSRKCVGDQFAVMEATVTLAGILRNFDFELDGAPEDVGMRTGATIHTENGLRMRVRERQGIPGRDVAAADPQRQGA